MFGYKKPLIVYLRYKISIWISNRIGKTYTRQNRLLM